MIRLLHIFLVIFTVSSVRAEDRFHGDSSPKNPEKKDSELSERDLQRIQWGDELLRGLGLGTPEEAKAKLQALLKTVGESIAPSFEDVSTAKLQELDKKLVEFFGQEPSGSQGSSLTNYLHNFVSGKPEAELVLSLLKSRGTDLDTLAYFRQNADNATERRVMTLAIQKAFDKKMAEDGNFKTQTRAEAQSGTFLIHEDVLHQKELLNKILEEPGTKLIVATRGGTPESLADEKTKKNVVGDSIPEKYHDRVTLVKSGQVTNGTWITDYKPIEATTQEGKKVFLDPLYFPGVGRNSQDKSARALAKNIHQAEVHEIPLALEDGNRAVIKGKDGKDYTVVSDEVFRVNEKLLGLDKGRVEAGLKKYLGENIVIVPAQNDGTGHVDMQFFSTQKGGKEVVFVPQLPGVVPLATKGILGEPSENPERFMSLASSKPLTLSQIAADGIAAHKSGDRFDRTAEILEGVVGKEQVVRYPIMPPKGANEPGYADRVFSPNVNVFVNSNNEKKVIFPEFPEELGNENYKAKVKEKLAPYFDEIKFAEGTSLYNQCGGFHCVASQIHPETIKIEKPASKIVKIENSTPKFEQPPPLPYTGPSISPHRYREDRDTTLLEEKTFDAQDYIKESQNLLLKQLLDSPTQR